MLNGHGPRRLQAQGSSLEDPRADASERSANKLIEELAGLLNEQTNSDRQGFARPRADLQDRGGSAPHRGDIHSRADQDDELAVPIPSSWVNQAAPASAGGWLSEQVRAALLGFGVGLVIVLPMVLLLTGQFGQFSFMQSVPGAKSPGPTTTASTVSMPQTNAGTLTRSPLPSAPAGSERVTTAASVSAASEPAKSEPVSNAVPPALPQTASLQPAQPPQPTPVQAATSVQQSALPAREPDVGAALLLEGRQLIENGDVAGARQVLTRAIETQPVKPEALFALAETFDPNMLAAWGARAVTADVPRARALYAKSLDGGLEKASARLGALN